MVFLSKMKKKYHCYWFNTRWISICVACFVFAYVWCHWGPQCRKLITKRISDLNLHAAISNKVIFIIWPYQTYYTSVFVKAPVITSHNWLVSFVTKCNVGGVQPTIVILLSIITVLS